MNPRIRSGMKACTGWILAAVLCVVPISAAAQSDTTSGIGGVVRDPSGAVLPGVTVEASSPVLIEKVRTVVTDGGGNYKVVDLRPGTYSVTFTLPGFSTVKREGIELNSGFTAAINAELKVGDISETITVTGASPVVDVQNTRTQAVLSEELLRATPAGRMNPHAFVAMTLGVKGGAVQDVGGSNGEQGAGIMSYHGINSTDSRLRYDGMEYMTLGQNGGGSSRWYHPNTLAVSEANLGLGGHTADSETAGVQQNLVPKEGGNKVSLSAVGVYANEHFQSDNLSDEIRSRGLDRKGAIKLAYDAGVGVGGPIRTDTLWFFGTAHYWGNQNILAGSFYNATQHTPFYTPDLSRPAIQKYPDKDFGARMTWQATKSNKLTFAYHDQRSCQCVASGSPTQAPEAGINFNFKPRLIQSTWTMPATNRLLFQAGMTYMKQYVISTPVGDQLPTDVNIQDTGTGQNYGSVVTGFPSNSSQTWGNSSTPLVTRFAVSYVTGSHAFKAGVNTTDGTHEQNSFVNQGLSYRFLNRRPTTVVQYASPFDSAVGVQSRGLFAQDQWTMSKLTLNLGVRYDSYKSRVKPITIPSGPFVPERSFGEVDNVPNYKDISPRFGAAYDVFGNGKTAVKGFFGRYVSSMGASLAELNSPARRAVLSVTRTWNDLDADYVPDCVLTNLSANGECGVVSDRLFGTVVPGTTYSDDVLRGWHKRSFTWQGSISLQQELRPGLSATLGYFRNSYGNAQITSNQSVTAADFTLYCVTAPLNALLPDGGGQQVCGNYDVSLAKFGQVNNLVGRASEFGLDNLSRVYNGVDVSLAGRFGRGQLSGGVSIGRTVTDDCALNASPNLIAGGQAFEGGGGVHPLSTPYCHIEPPWSQSAEFKATGSHPLPYGFELGAVFQNRPGIARAANNTYTNAQVAPGLGRNLSRGATGTVTIPILAPQTAFEDRLSQLDLRFSKIFRVGGTARLKATLDLYNALNASAITSVNATYGSRWLEPQVFMFGRYAKVGGQFDF